MHGENFKSFIKMYDLQGHECVQHNKIEYV